MQKLERDIAYKEAQKRGWFSYTELSCLMNSMQLIAVAHAVVNVSSICLATYTAGVVTLLGSALVASYLPGTVLNNPRQATNSTDIMKADFNSEMDMTSPIEILSENVLTTDFISTSLLLNCNQSQQNCEHIKIHKITNGNWRWLSSIMIWLPQYSDIESKKSLQTTIDKTKHVDTSIATKFLFDVTISDEPLIKFWKQILSIDLKIFLHDWRYYANYITKFTFDHQH